MIDHDRVLRPFDEAKPSIEQLQVYESPAALKEALRATWHAVDASLRILLRSDPRVPDGLRLSAMSRDELPTDAVVTELRRHDLITMHLAGRIHEFGQAISRIERDDLRAADADRALEVVATIRAEVLRHTAPPDDRPSWERPSASPAKPIGTAGSSSADELDMVGDDVVVPTTSGGEPRPLRRPIIVAAAAIVLVALAAIMVVVFGRTSDMEEGVVAFRAGRTGVAEQHFRAALQRDSDNVTARLYLSRILRDQGRNQEAADLLREAVRIAPRDGAVRRELGYLFLALNRPQQAVPQFQQSVELQPDEALGWVGLVQAQRRSGDVAGAELTMGRAPAAARAMLQTTRPQP